MLYELFHNFFLIFFPESILNTYPYIFNTIEIVFLILFLIFLFFGLTSLAKK